MNASAEYSDDSALEDLVDLITYECKITGKKSNAIAPLDDAASSISTCSPSSPELHAASDDAKDARPQVSVRDDSNWAELAADFLQAQTLEQKEYIVTCKEVVLHAKSSSSKDPGVKALARLSLGHTEEGVHRVFAKQGLSLPVKISYADFEKCPKIPYIKLSDWILYLSSASRLHFLTGVKDPLQRHALCKEFWARWRLGHPNHPIFASGQDLSRCVPILHHGDEGRTYRRLAIMVLSTHGVLGKGTHHHHPPTGVPPAQDEMRMNFVGATILSHYIFAAMPHGLYKQAPDVLDRMLAIYSEDIRSLSEDGVTTTNDGHLFFWCIGIKGDLPYLAKTGHMDRSFGRGPKQSSSKKPCAGVCWKCDAGREDLPFPCPFEDCTLDATWRQTVGRNPGWTVPSPLLAIPHDATDPTSFFVEDLWHCWHLGCGKSFISSVIVVVVTTMNGPSIPYKLTKLTADFRAYCKRKKIYCSISAITQDLLAWDSTAAMPQGSWHKGAVTTCLMTWMQDFLARDPEMKESVNVLLPVIVPTLEMGNRFMGTLYKKGVWIRKTTARAVAEMGYAFLQGHMLLARMCFNVGLQRFIILPKQHMICHTVFWMFDQADIPHCQWVLNPLVFSVQMQEDFIGKPSRLSRRVCPKLAMHSLRTIQRALLNMASEFDAAEQAS
ncbi:unnamed protein product [Symbiodinium sp. CCMP2592]|nr:unnamed protein product [Symbiodinium sp. CCMP2592]